MAELSAFVPIESRHGDDCTCPPAGRITLDLVKANPACTGDRSPQRNRAPRDGSPCGPLPYPGRVIITLPGEYPAWWQIAVHDKDTGDLMPVAAFNLGFDYERGQNTEPMTVTLRLPVDEEDRPLHVKENGFLPQARREADGTLVTRIFRCPVAETRLARPNPLSAHDHTFTADFSAQPTGIGSCGCGMTWEHYLELHTQEISGTSHAAETAKPVDQHGRAVDATEPSVPVYEPGITDNPHRAHPRPMQ